MTIERKTIIKTNGSHFAGEPLDTLEQLYDRLRTETLDPGFEQCGDFCHWAPSGDGNPAMLKFFGNFHTYSHAFDIETNDPRVIETLVELIVQNKSTPAYAEAKRNGFEFKVRSRQPAGRARV